MENNVNDDYERWLNGKSPDLIELGDGKPGFQLDLSDRLAALRARLSASAGKDRS